MKNLKDMNIVRNETEIMRMAVELSKILGKAHQNGIFHGNIRPEFILLDDQNHFQLEGWGSKTETENTIEGIRMFTKDNYLSPEQYKEGLKDEKSDLYSLGLILYQWMNDGLLPFYPIGQKTIKSSDRRKALEKRMNGNPIPALNLKNSKLNSLIMKLCAYNADSRYQDAVSMLKDLSGEKEVKTETILTENILIQEDSVKKAEEEQKKREEQEERRKMKEAQKKALALQEKARGEINLTELLEAEKEKLQKEKPRKDNSPKEKFQENNSSKDKSQREKSVKEKSILEEKANKEPVPAKTVKGVAGSKKIVGLICVTAVALIFACGFLMGRLGQSNDVADNNDVIQTPEDDSVKEYEEQREGNSIIREYKEEDGGGIRITYSVPDPYNIWAERVHPDGTLLYKYVPTQVPAYPYEGAGAYEYYKGDPWPSCNYEEEIIRGGYYTVLSEYHSLGGVIFYALNGEYTGDKELDIDWDVKFVYKQTIEKWSGAELTIYGYDGERHKDGQQLYVAHYDEEGNKKEVIRYNLDASENVLDSHTAIIHRDGSYVLEYQYQNNMLRFQFTTEGPEREVLGWTEIYYDEDGEQHEYEYQFIGEDLHRSNSEKANCFTYFRAKSTSLKS